MSDRTERYHRRESSTQTPADAALQEATGELWGRAPRASYIPAVKAYLGPLPPGVRGIEFTADIEPDRGTGPYAARWTGPRAGVIVDEEFARIEVISNTQR